MYLTRYQKKQLLTLIILIVGIPLTIFAGYQAVQWFTDASVDTEPRNVVIGNITTNSVTITWTTGSRTIGAVIPILSDREMGQVTDRRGVSRRNTHYVELRSLEPSTKYEFKIVSSGDRYGSSGNSAFSFTTANISSDTPVPKPIHGDIKDGSGEDVLVYVLTKDKSTYPIITTPSSSGNWLLDLSSFRSISDRSMVSVTDSTELVIIAVSGVDNGGVVEGAFSTIFDSRGKLNQDLISTGGSYDSYIPDNARLVVGVDDPEPRPRPDPDPDPDPIPDPIEEDEFDEREWDLRRDLVWLNLVDEQSGIGGRPEQFGEETVLVTNLTDTGFNILWYSERKEAGRVKYGTSKTSLDERGRDVRDGIASEGDYFLHKVELTRLVPETTYYFEIHSGSDIYDNNGSKYEVRTFATQSSPPPFENVSGSININETESVVVVATIIDDDGVGSSGQSLPISTLVDSRGAWILTIGGARTETGEYFNKSNNDIIEFTPKYFSDLPITRKTVGEATSAEVVLDANITLRRYVRVPLLGDYGLVTL